MKATIIYDGYDFSDFGVELIESNVPGAPTARIDIQEVPYGRGVSQGQYYRPLILTATVDVKGISTADVKTKLDKIADILDVDSDKTLVFDQLGYNDRRWWARRSASSQPVWTNYKTVRLAWQFLAADPVAESVDLTTENYNPTSDNYTFHIPNTATDVVAGNHKAYPIYILKATGANGPPVKLENGTRDEETHYIVSLPNTHWLKIDTNLYSVEKSTDNGASWASVVGSISDASKFPLLTPAARNKFLLTNGDDTTVTVTYRARYLGG